MAVRHTECGVCGSDIVYDYLSAGGYDWDLKHHFTKKGNCPYQIEKRDKNGVN